MTVANAVTAVELETKALELRRQGLPYSEIAKALGTSTAYAYQVTVRGIKKLAARRDQQAVFVLGLELSRLEELGRKVYEKALAGDLKALEGYLKVMDRRARYLGLDAPAKVDNKHTFDGRSEEELVVEARRYGIEVPIELRPTAVEVTDVPGGKTESTVRDSHPDGDEVSRGVPTGGGNRLPPGAPAVEDGTGPLAG